MRSGCCANCKLGKPLEPKGYEMPTVWCKKHRDAFISDSCCESYQADKMFKGCNEDE